MDRIMKRADNPSSLQEAQTEPSSKQQQQQATLRSYLSTSTIHGLSKLGESTHWSLRLLWGVIIFALLLISVYNIYELTVEFLQFQTYYSIQDHSNSTAKFPSVTICNANNYQKSKVNSLVENVDKRFHHFFSLGIEKGGDGQPFPGTAAFLFHNNVTLTKATQSASETLLLDALKGWCMFDILKACTRDDFVDTFFDANSGFCKTFNPNGTFNQAIAGPIGGLTLTLYLNQEDYMRFVPINGGAGVFLTVHPKDVFPTRSSTWFAIQPGTQTHLSIAQKITFRKPKPYNSKCVNRDGDMIYPGRYNVEVCTQSCRNRKTYERCGYWESAALHHLRLKGKHFPPPKSDILTNGLKCKLELLMKEIGKNQDCDCPLPCWEESFVLSSSSSRWPSEVDMQYYSQVLSKVLNRTDVSNDFIYSNILQLKIFFKTLGYQEVREVPNMSFSSIIAGIGGSLGLFMGASFFSVLEFVGFIINVCFGRRQKNLVSPNES